MADIFISYAREDRAIAERLASAIEASGKSVWWDRHIKGGSQFSKDIERELHAAKAAGMVGVGVLTGTAGRAELEPHAETVLSTVGGLPDWLEGRAAIR